MHSLKTTCVGQIFALAKPHDSVGKRTRNRIPKEERKTLVESFIKKHQKLNNGSFPSLSLTHKEVGGSFYTIREIVREIIQENRVLGPGDLLLEGNGSVQDQSLSSSILMDPVPPLSLSPNGFHSGSYQSLDFSSESPEGNVNGSQVCLDNCREVSGSQLLKEDIGLVHQSMDSTDISMTQLATSCSEDNDIKSNAGLQNRMETVCDSVDTKPQDKRLDVDNKDEGFEELRFMESDGTKPVNNDDRVNDAGAAMTEIKNGLGTIDMSAETVVETFPLKSVTSTMDSPDAQPTELNKVCEGGKGTETEVEADRSTVNHVDLGEISSSTSSAVLEDIGTEVIVGQIPNHISVPMEKKVGEEIVNSASVDVECADAKETVVVNGVIGNVHETKEFSNGTLTAEQKMPTSSTESGSRKNDRAKVDTVSSYAGNEVASVEKKATMEKGKIDAPDSSSSQKENNATLNRIKPESWKGESNMGRQETNPLLAVLKSFVTAFVKFWSE
ncbi:hypothetical protein AtNW77_Chr3g0207501 [Arabidopsis thaliana]|jgi:hypothetical protein|uniref:DNA binding protein n=4 Tax=Arabidopsis TaxID=3701 RepID=Q8L641_ARATH|nr:DNA binding protein [Arabidopsis thaliana]NP_190785.2 DNA binding protein [Arabidopsis thaliana]KAG7628210.1 hypothetical protein ISN45_At03g044850 [Arabidopsis thaliana x Arabidopsis arenosa]KAG7634120.1 hypothetical protein ISN44_As03g043800 [Arabidopsis suecica]AAM20147.1 unknown protein [Arabidopsis thaliana]AEE78907.1 DNA binding protein [Arabidopsis thaliana]AEE78908.1 DNA binding protein [Arabidopsis thaliana]|eukprot:NP_001190069.1 DNA binding protein [Arabidopsis thaliana]